ncbi:efflux RND transporter periplasmic adaptor subunit [Thalassotalea fusca]
MTRKKQIIVPIVIVLAGIVLFALLAGMKKPPEEKAKEDNTPIVAVESITVAPMTLHVDSYGVIKPKYETELVAQISGQIVELSDAFVRGGFVSKGQLLAVIDPSDYEAALIDAEATLASAHAALETERAQGMVAEEEWKRISNATPTALSLRKPQLAQELARVKAAEASVLRAKRNLERTQIKAPYDAMIDDRSVGLGSFVAMGTRVGKLLSTDTAEVRLPVADNQLQFLVDHGKNAEVVIKGSFGGQSTTWSAKIVRSEGVIDEKSRMSYLVAEVRDPYALSSEYEQKPVLRFGSYINAEILGQSLANATMVPRYLVNNGRVAILSEESKLQFVEVDIVRQVGANVVISQGLNTGDQMIVSALDYPIDGMQLALPTDESDLENQSEDGSDTQIASVKE